MSAFVYNLEHGDLKISYKYRKLQEIPEDKLMGPKLLKELVGIESMF